MLAIEVFLALEEDEAALPEVVARAAAIPRAEILSLRVARRSLDARKGHPIGWRLRVEVLRAGEPASREVPLGLPPPERAPGSRRVVVIGSGPAGTFAAWRLAQAGIAVTVVERGKPVQPRRHDLAALVQRGALDPDSNYCFGEGGAGTFSDGKLYTRVKDRRAVDEVLRVLVEHGADRAIAVESRPHIGSNRLPKILIALREALIARGVAYVWSDEVIDLAVGGGRVCGVRLRSGAELSADAVVLAVGHSARPVYELLHRRGVALVAKSFAVGARVEHPQPLIDRQQYGRAAGHPKLPAAFYELTAQVPSGSGERGVYSFCMCPGGWIVAAATEPEALCTNGMSLSRRDSPFADAALVVTVEPRDFGADAGGPLAGLEFQRAIERRAFAAGGGGFVAPGQRITDFLAGRATDAPLASSYRPGVVGGRVDDLLPPFVAEALRKALPRFGRTVAGFAGESGQVVGVETRTSSPVRVVRDDRSLQSPSLPGLYPAGEGAGYAGGIVSAAIDGLRIADAILGA
ncbi:MAG: FAD-dependent oxidoreductase [Myxococcales bacterium]|nr:FAD-dependent oxidoreductase [Myxococcales bacterium]